VTTLNPEPTLEITFRGAPSAVENATRVACLTAILEMVVSKEHHIDDLRQRHVAVALIVFAGLFGFGLKTSQNVNPLWMSAALTLLMLVFCILDRRLHMFSHGWRRTRSALIRRVADAANNPSQDVSFLRYDAPAEWLAEWWSVQPMIYYALVLGGGLSYLVFR
jgi:hypothetical protein